MRFISVKLLTALILLCSPIFIHSADIVPKETPYYQTIYEKHIITINLGIQASLRVDEFYNLYSGKTPVYINKLQAQTLITNITVLTNSPDVVVTNTNIVDNIISNPSEAEIQDQNKYNVNALRLEINDKYNIQLSTYK